MRHGDLLGGERIGVAKGERRLGNDEELGLIQGQRKDLKGWIWGDCSRDWALVLGRDQLKRWSGGVDWMGARWVTNGMHNPCILARIENRKASILVLMLGGSVIFSSRLFLEGGFWGH